MTVKKLSAAMLAVLVLAGCEGQFNTLRDKERAESDAAETESLNEIMLNLAEPDQAVEYFRAAVAKEPDRVDMKRSLAQSLVRAKRYSEAALVYEQLVESGNASAEDRIEYADALVRNGAWDTARAQLNAVPPKVETFDRYFLEAIVADHFKEWKKADSFYDIARGLTPRPAQVYNNWGISKQTRGDLDSAEKLFKQAIASDPQLFPAKNNLVIIRGKRKIYELPVIPTTETERAILMYNLAQEAIKNGDIEIAKGLLEAAIDLHPQYFEPAVRLLASL
ncbi:MAG TPA: tetratricopeptide repeat protein [Paracoccaceae bacterium]|nr:tetratricopeptide repeat protein [Paracoccaceae bacterium]